MKKTSPSQLSSNLKFLAVFTAGLLVATLGWYYSDRLDIAFGQAAGINMIGRGGESGMFDKCNPNDPPKLSRKIDGCNVVTTTQVCQPNTKYRYFERTKSGARIVESDTQKRGSIAVSTSDVALKLQTKNVHLEVGDATKELDTYRQMNSKTNLAKDSHYQTLLQNRDDLKNLENSVKSSCPIKNTAN